eukprot:8765516-Alexandrium_andersonii.AAC.1
MPMRAKSTRISQTPVPGSDPGPPRRPMLRSPLGGRHAVRNKRLLARGGLLPVALPNIAARG